MPKTVEEVKEMTLPIAVTLSGDQVDRIESVAPKRDSQTLSRMATGLLIDMADGGLMLAPDIMKRLLKAAPEAVTAGKVLELVEASKSRRGEHLVAEWVVDPVYEPYLREQARLQGLTVQQIVQNMMDTAIGNSWFYDLNPEPERLVFSQQDMQYIAEVIGKPEGEKLTGTDIVKFIRELNELPIERI